MKAWNFTNKLCIFSEESAMYLRAAPNLYATDGAHYHCPGSIPRTSLKNLRKEFIGKRPTMNENKGTRPQRGVVMDNAVEEELCRQAFTLFDKSGSGTISKTVGN